MYCKPLRTGLKQHLFTGGNVCETDVYSPEIKNREVTKTIAPGTCKFRFSFVLASLVSRLVKQIDRGDVTTGINVFASSFSRLFAFEILT